VIGILIGNQSTCNAANRTYQEDSKELQFQDLLMVYLNEQIERDVNFYYLKNFNRRVDVYPYDVDFIKIERLNGFRGFDFRVTVETNPSVGAHNSVGKDRLTYEIAFSINQKAKLLKHEHLKTYLESFNL
jgi:hypothetical protein